MREVLDYIDERAARLAQKPLFAYMRDEQLEASERLRFVPCTAHFIMTFADLCHFVLPNDPPADEFELLANSNLREEADHWKWFLADLTTLGLDPSVRFTDAIRFLWGEQTLESRRLSYEICKLAVNLRSLHKLVMVLAVEATGRVALEAATPAGQAWAKGLEKKLVYFGGHHLNSELSHTLAADASQEKLRLTTLNPEARLSMLRVVDQIFDRFGAFVDSLFALRLQGGDLKS